MSDEFPKPSGDCITDRMRQRKAEAQRQAHSLHRLCSAAGGQQNRIRTWKCGCGLSAEELHKINWVRYVQGYAQCKQCHHDLEEY